MTRATDFTASIDLIEGAHLRVQADEQWEIYERYLELETPPPFGASMRLVDGSNTDLVGWSPLTAISLVHGQSLLLRRLERLEAAVTHDLNLWPFGALRAHLVLPPQAEFWPEFRHCALPRLHPSLGYDQGLELAAEQGILVRGIRHVVGKRVPLEPKVPRP